MTSPKSGSDARSRVLMAGVSKEHRIIEVGASFRPLAPKRDGWKTCIVDHETRENLIAKYAGADIRPEEIEEVDIVWREGQLHNAVPQEFVGCCDAVIVSHVLEHLPDLIGFLKSVRLLVHDQGRLIFALPDKRWCFDCFRSPTLAGDVLQAHHEHRQVHSFAARFNEIAYSITADGKIGWGFREKVRNLRFFHPLRRIHDLVQSGPVDQSTYEDAHAWHFTPASFKLLVLDLALAGACDWRVEWIKSGQAVEFLGHLRPGATGFSSEDECQQLRLNLLIDVARECEKQWRSILVGKTRKKFSLQKVLARFLGDNKNSPV